MEVYSPFSGKSRLLKKVDSSELQELYWQFFDLDITEMLNGVKEIGLYECAKTSYRFYFPFELVGNTGLYEKLAENSWYYMPWKWEHEVAIEDIPKNASVLEIGCGRGDFIDSLARKNLNTCVGLELNKAVTESTSGERLTIFNETVESYANRGSAFDVVCCFQVLEHVAQVDTFLRASVQIMKPGGRFLVCVPNNESFIKRDKNNILNMPPHHMGLWSERSLRKIAKLYGLRPVKVKFEPLQLYHVDWFVRTMLSAIFSSKVYNKLLAGSLFEMGCRWLIAKMRNSITGHSIYVYYEKE